MNHIKKDIKLQRIVMEVFGGCNYTCQMCPQSTPGRGSNFTRKMPIKQFESILDKIVPKYRNPIINLEGSGEPTMAKDFDSIEYCKDCDFLYEDPEVLVWSNDPEARPNHMLGTDNDFTLTDYSLDKLV